MRWKVIEDYPNYMISDIGLIKNIKSGYTTKGRNSGSRRYYEFRFPDGKEVKVHRIVAQYFCQGYFYGAVVNHIDKNTFNNEYTNLEWTTIADNNSTEKSEGGRKGREATRKPVGKYSKEGILLKSYDAVRDVEEDGFHSGCVSKVCKGERNTHKNYIWRYL